MNKIRPEMIELLQLAPIKVLNFSNRTLNALLKNRVSTVGKILTTDEHVLEKMRGLGETSISEVLSSKQRIEKIIDQLIESNGNPEGDDLFEYIYNFNEDTNEINISSLNLSKAIKDKLLFSGISTLRDLINYSEDQITPILGGNPMYTSELVDVVYRRILNNTTTLRKQILLESSSKDIRCLGLSSRALNSLQRNDINTIGQLLECTKKQLLSFRGLGSTALDDINERLEIYVDSLLSKDGDSNGRSGLTIGEYWNSVPNDQRNNELLVKYYNGGRDKTLDSLGNEYGITRERVRQLIKKGEQKIRNAYLFGSINPKIKEAIEKASTEMTEINLVYVGDDIFTNAGAIHLLASAIPESVHIYKGPLINGEWLVRNEKETDNQITSLANLLLDRTEPMLLSDAITIFGVREDIIFSLKNIVEYNGYITLSTNRSAMGTDRISIVSNYLEALGRPASINEIAENTGLTFNQVRGAVSSPGYFVNVGKSIYDLANADYSDKNTGELIENILSAEDRALKISAVISYVRLYDKLIINSQINHVIDDNDSKFRRSGEYVLFKEWGDEKIITFAPSNYQIPLEDAILNIINDSENGEIFNTENMVDILAEKYGDTVSTNYNSVKQTLIKLRDEERIMRVGQNTSGYYCKNR